VPEERLESPAARERGREIFLENCALCHGDKADGEGRRRNLSSRPQDFTDPSWLERTTPRENFHDVREGVRGTAMASWKVLGDDQIWDLVAYLRSVASG
jgi:high-affinity iron transporter